MRVFLVDKTINKNIVYSQLFLPLKLLNNRNCVLLVPKHIMVGINNQDVYFHVFCYERTFAKYRKLLSISNVEDVYTRSVVEFIYLYIIRILFLRKWTITYDFRGLAYAEYGLRHRHFIKYHILKSLEYFVCKRTDYLRTVSWAFANFLKLEFASKKDIKVIPCCLSRANFIAKLNRSDCSSFVFVGSLASWQRIEHILDIYKLIAKRIDSKLTIITNEVISIRSLLAEKNIFAEVISLPQHEVEKELWKYDFGFLLRENMVVNNVASPIKFLEYIGNGVIPIISEGIGDYSRLVKEENIGIIENDNIETMIMQILEFKLREDIQKHLYNVASKYTWDNYLKIL